VDVRKPLVFGNGNIGMYNDIVPSESDHGFVAERTAAEYTAHIFLLGKSGFEEFINIFPLHVLVTEFNVSAQGKRNRFCRGFFYIKALADAAQAFNFVLSKKAQDNRFSKTLCFFQYLVRYSGGRRLG
jgi:hypothetical protein